jgi:hypothetical protein
MREKASIRHYFLSSSPIAIACNMPWVRVVLLILSLFLFAVEIRTIYVIINLGLPAFNHYKFTALQRRDGGDPVGPGIYTFGLLTQENGGHSVQCPAQLNQAVFTRENASMVMSMSPDYRACGDCIWRPTERLTGWYFVTDAGTSTLEADPVGYLCMSGLLCVHVCMRRYTYMDASVLCGHAYM